MDYFVPHFGMDRDIQGSLENLHVAEGIVKHHWVGIDKDKYANPAKKVDYNFAPKLDGDIVDSKKNLADTEKSLKHNTVIEDMQTEADLHAEADPICSSAGCT
jgi:hypothetical protein